MAAAAGLHDPAAMAAGPSGATETALLFDLSASPPKPAAEDASMNAPSTRRRFANSRTPTDRGTSRSASVKRTNVSAGARPPRGRPDSPWEDDVRAVHRRVQFPVDPQATVQAGMEALRRQSESDREHMLMLKNAIEGIYVAQRQQMVDLTSAAQRGDQLEGALDRDRTITRTELQKLAGEMPARINGAVDIIVQPYVAQVAKMQAYLEQLDKDRPVEGVTLMESFRLLDANIAEMKAKINQYSVHTDGQIAAAQGAAISAAQGAAVSMPNEEVVTLNKMHQELEVLKTWSTTAATKDQIAHHERCLTFINAQLAGTNERLSELAATHGDGVTGAMAAPSVEPAGETPPPLMTASRGAVNGGKCHCVHLDLLTVRVQALEAARTAAAAAARQPFMPYLRQDATAFVPGAVA